MWSGVESAERGSNNGRDPKSTPSTRLKIGNTSTREAGGELPERNPMNTTCMYTWGADHMSRKLILVTGKGSQRQLEHDTVVWRRL